MGNAIIDYEKIEWLDITEELRKCSQDLNIGELVHGKSFFLIEAMSAIEIMDPKVDEGMLYNRTKKIMTFEQAISAGKVKINNITNEEKIGIIDDTFSCLVTWLEGHSPTDTVFTNLYLHNPKLIEDECLKAFSYAILKIVFFINQIIISADIVQPEDFPSFYIPFDSDLVDNEVALLLKDAENSLKKDCEKIKKNNVDANEINSLFKNLDISEESDISLQQKENRASEILTISLYNRIKFTKALYNYLSIIFNHLSLKSPNLLSQISKEIKICIKCFDYWEKTIDIGVKPNLGEFDENSFLRDGYPTIMGFSPLIKQRNMDLTFPRQIKISKRSEMIEKIKYILDALKHILEIFDIKSLKETIDFFSDFSNPFKRKSCVLTRSILQVIQYCPNLIFDSKFSLETLMNDAKQFVNPPSLHLKCFTNLKENEELLQTFFLDCAFYFTSLINAYGYNRARLKKKLANLIDNFHSLHLRAKKLDSYFDTQAKTIGIKVSHDGYYATWITYYLMKIVIQNLFLGFELELYSQHEYSYLYWNLEKLFLPCLIKILLNASELYDVQKVYDNNAHRNKKQIKNRIKDNRECKKVIIHMQETTFYQGVLCLTEALQKVCFALIQLGKIKSCLFIKENQRLLLSYRLKPLYDKEFFSFVCKDKYFEVLEHEQNDFSLSHEINEARDQLLVSKSIFELLTFSNKEVESCVKVLKTNLVILNLVCNGKEIKEKPEFDFSIHPNFPVIRLV